MIWPPTIGIYFHQSPSKSNMLPLTSLSFNTLQSLVYTSKTEDELARFLAPGAVVFSGQQIALESCFEALGVGLYNTPVLLPALAPSWFVAAILRAGGLPVMLDATHWAGHYDFNTLSEAANDLEECVILHWCPNGRSLPPVVGEQLGDKFVMISITDALPAQTPVLDGCKFHIANLHPAVDKGAVVFSAHEDSYKILSQIKNGMMGRGDSLVGNYGLAFQLLKKTREVIDMGVLQQFVEELGSMVLSTGSVYLPVSVVNAVAAKNDLYMAGYEAGLGCTDLTSIPEIRARFPKEVPFYPKADALHNSVVLLPCHAGVEENTIRNISRIVKHYRRR